MPTVVTFWQTHEDENKFIEFLKNSGEIVAIPFGKHRTRSELNSQPLSSSLLDNWKSALFTLAEHVDEVRFASFCDNGNENVSVSPILSPVIAYESGGMREYGLTPTNVFAYWVTRVDSEGKQQWIEKPEWFSNWGKEVFKWLRRHANQKLDGKALPMTESVASAAARGLVLYQD
ncbi:hypothetical protein [Blastopirellula marina]|uniref:Uncharacterized protein n=1 Tax=Blastopirellula marina TaxID=124 RepID=A0A2S8GSC6_9BACT|nr:hypothetical protein [Blastopirellula marina]PQO47338.1 hypothetical protein C5Y93_04670 [Blastopirellula marina]